MKKTYTGKRRAVLARYIRPASSSRAEDNDGGKEGCTSKADGAPRRSSYLALPFTRWTSMVSVRRDESVAVNTTSTTTGAVVTNSRKPMVSGSGWGGGDPYSRVYRRSWPLRRTSEMEIFEYIEIF